MRIGSVCVECFYLKMADHGKSARCDKHKFKERLPLVPWIHPFISLPRACLDFDEDLFEEEKNNTGKTGEDVV